MLKRSALVTLLVVGALFSTAQAQDDLIEINYLTSFSTFGRDAYAYVAKEMGFFEEAGLDVNINPGSGTVSVMQLIAAGTADFGPGDAATAFIAIANEGLDLKAVAAVQQNTLAAVIALESSGIATPQDLAGRTFADAAGSTNRILLPAYADAAGFDDSTVEFVAAAPPDLPRLLASGTVDFIGQFVVGRSLIETAAGEPAVILPYSDYLPDLYGNMIIARNEMIEEQPEVVEAFIGALMRGLQYSIDHPEETGEILVNSVDGQNAEIAANEVEIMHDFVLPPDYDGAIGAIDAAKVQAMIDMLTEAGAITTEVSAEDVFAPGFTD